MRNEKMYQKILKHGNELNAIFNTGLEPVVLSKKLKRLEAKASKAATCLCNTNTLHLMELNRWTGYDVQQATEDEVDAYFEKIEKSVIGILGDKAMQCLVINFDPRGYALKISDKYIRDNNLSIYQDWGGYGILAPDFDNN